MTVILDGQLDVATKFHSGPLLQVLHELRCSELPRLELILYGEATNPGMEHLWRAKLELYCLIYGCTWWQAGSGSWSSR